MDDIADKLARIETEENAEEMWKTITSDISRMSPHRVPLLWGALLRNLAREPPAMPQGDITQSQWMAMCQAQYQELYRCALRDAGITDGALSVSSGGNSASVVRSAESGSDMEGIRQIITDENKKVTDAIVALEQRMQTLTPPVDLSPIIDENTRIGSIIESLREKVLEQNSSVEEMKTAIVGIKQSVDSAPDVINGKFVELQASVHKHEDIMARTLTEMGKNANDNKKEIMNAVGALQAEVDTMKSNDEKITSELLELKNSSDQSMEALKEDLKSIHASVDGKISKNTNPPPTGPGEPQSEPIVSQSPRKPIPEWVEITGDSTQALEMLKQQVPFMVQRGTFLTMFHTNETEFYTPNYKPHYNWFWKGQVGGKLFISQNAMNQILDARYLATQIMAGNDTKYKQRVTDLTKHVSNFVGTSLSIPNTLLALLINRYCYENKDKPDAKTILNIKYNYYDLPFTPEETTKSGKICYKLCPDVIVVAQFAFNFFKDMYQPPAICPFQLPPKPYLSSEWDPDEWFQSELKSKPIADAWFSSIATTLSRRSESP